MLLALAAAASVATATPVESFPVDQAARNSFPNEPGEAVDIIAYVHKYVNGAMTYVGDQEHYGLADHWVASPADMKGDCEDYALTKQEILEEMGFPILTSGRIRTVLVHTAKGNFGHAILELKLPNGSIMELDQLWDEPMRREDLEKTYGYTFFDW